MERFTVGGVRAASPLSFVSAETLLWDAGKVIAAQTSFSSSKRKAYLDIN